MKDVQPEDSVTEVLQIMKTTAGGVLIEISKCGDRAKLQEAIKKAVAEKREIRSIVPKLRIEVLDLDGLKNESDVEEAI